MSISFKISKFWKSSNVKAEEKQNLLNNQKINTKNSGYQSTIDQPYDELHSILNSVHGGKGYAFWSEDENISSVAPNYNVLIAEFLDSETADLLGKVAGDFSFDI